jgi:hypothetical protein
MGSSVAPCGWEHGSRRFLSDAPPHLTVWRSKFALWWEQHGGKSGNVQSRQMRFPEIAELEADIENTSRRLILLRQKLERGVFGDSVGHPTAPT